MAFSEALECILQSEGGFVNHPKDPGGMTNLGVTKRTWEEWTKRPASESEMRGLTQVKVAPLYKVRYWNRVAGDDLPPALALCVFDFGVNAGPGRAVKLLQRLVGAVVDGQAGKGTIAAVNTYVAAHGLPATVKAYQDARKAYYRALPTFKHFGKGWLARVDRVTKEALA